MVIIALFGYSRIYDLFYQISKKQYRRKKFEFELVVIASFCQSAKYNYLSSSCWSLWASASLARRAAICSSTVSLFRAYHRFNNIEPGQDREKSHSEQLYLPIGVFALQLYNLGHWLNHRKTTGCRLYLEEELTTPFCFYLFRLIIFLKL